jgi:hypothetical protein
LPHGCGGTHQARVGVQGANCTHAVRAVDNQVFASRMTVTAANVVEVENATGGAGIRARPKKRTVALRAWVTGVLAATRPKPRAWRQAPWPEVHGCPEAAGKVTSSSSELGPTIGGFDAHHPPGVRWCLLQFHDQASGLSRVWPAGRGGRHGPWYAARVQGHVVAHHVAGRGRTSCGHRSCWWGRVHHDGGRGFGQSRQKVRRFWPLCFHWSTHQRLLPKHRAPRYRSVSAETPKDTGWFALATESREGSHLCRMTTRLMGRFAERTVNSHDDSPVVHR